MTDGERRGLPAALFLSAVFAVAVALYLPAAGYEFVHDDKIIIAENPVAHDVAAAARAFTSPYWPDSTGGGAYRPVTILSYAVDWSLSRGGGGGRSGWFHVVNALWHGLATVLMTLVLARWLPPVGALAAGLVFAVHPVHVEAVANIVGRAELLAATGIGAAVLAARRGWWIAALACAAFAALSKEHGVIAGVVILLDNWLQPHHERRWYPKAFYAGLLVVTAAYLVAWAVIGRTATSIVAAPFIGTTFGGRLVVALPAVLEAARLLVWPSDLSVDYNPQVIAAPATFSAATLGGALVVVALPLLIVRLRRRVPAVAFGAALAALSYLPTSNLLFASGVLLAERTLYLAVVLMAASVGAGAGWVAGRFGVARAGAGVVLIVLALGTRSALRLPVWRDSKSHLLITLADHPESAGAHAWAARVLAAMHDTAGARRQFFVADSLYPQDPHHAAARAFYLVGLRDTVGVAELVGRARERVRFQPIALRTQFLLELARGDRAAAAAVADTARSRHPREGSWYAPYAR